MDKLDYLILSELLKDAQMPFLTIAKKLGVSPSTIAKRYEKMKKDGTITRSVISLDLAKLGYQGKAFLMITNTPNKDKSATIDSLKKTRNIMAITEIIGAFDVLAIAPVSDLNSIKALVKEIKRCPSVQQVEITCINDTAFPINPSFGEVVSKKCLHLSASNADS
jgi:Lrp/AsnC family transcriptional regulator for asnA, asnC and gidA